MLDWHDKKIVKKYFDNLKPTKYLTWDEYFNLIKEYIKQNNSLPDINNESLQIQKLAEWINFQIINYNKCIGIMKNDLFRNKLKNYMDQYADIFKKQIINFN